jgi:hypothetical protein
MALNTTTTPTLTTHVKSVGLTVMSSAPQTAPELRCFLIILRSLEEPRPEVPFRLASDFVERTSAEAEVDVDVRLMVGWNVGSVSGASRGELCSRTEAGTIRSVFV